MRYIEHETEEKILNLYPFVCWHIGAPQSDEKFIKEMIERVKDDEFARWVYMGDGGENAIMGSKGDVYKQTMSPNDQVKELVRLLKPIKNKGLFAIRGNHGNRTTKIAGLDPDEMLAIGLGLPYLGTSAFMNLKVNRSRYTCFFHHGGDSGVAIASKISAAKKAEAFINADVIVTAHSHILMEIPPAYRVRIDSAKEEKLTWDTTYEYIAGSAYDSRSGYAEDKLYPPIIPSHIKLEFSGNYRTVNGSGYPEKLVTATLFRAPA